MPGPRSYKRNTISRLFALSGGRCAFPGCNKLLVNHDNAANSHICHIAAASPSGQRYRSDMSDEQRADYTNLIVLCPSHHKVTDDEKLYTIEKLKAMKAEHEAMIQRRVSASKPLQKRPSLLADVVKRIGKINLQTETEEAAAGSSFDIEAKITHNHVIRYRPFLQEHAVYAGKLQNLYIEFEQAGNGRVEILLRNIASLYSLQKGKLLGADTSLANIQQNADALIEAVKNDLHDLMESSPNNDWAIPYEEVEFALSIVLVDAFMRCRILERPL